MSSAPSAVVFGASGYIGSSSVEILSSRGWNVFGAVRSRQPNFVHPNVRYGHCDVSVSADVDETFRRCEENFGPACACVVAIGAFSAGLSRTLSFEGITDYLARDFALIAATASLSARNMARRSQRPTSLVLVGSTGSHAGMQGTALYAASKAALRGFVRSSAAEFARAGLRLNMVTVGLLDDGMAASATDAARSQWVDRTALGRTGSGREVGEVVEFLCSDRSSFVCGSDVSVDGGFGLR